MIVDVAQALEDPMTARRQRWVAILCITVVIAVLTPTVIDRLLLIRFNRAISAVRETSITSVSFKPHVDREFVKISDPRVLGQIQKWLGRSKTPRAFYSYPPTTCPLEITLANGSFELFEISPTGLTAAYFVENDIRSFERQRRIRAPCYRTVVTIDCSLINRLLLT